MRLIDADALKEFYGKWSNKHTEFLKPEVDLYIDRQPTIDAVPVVRCRDCANTCEVDDGMVCVVWGAWCDGNEFCSRAERKDGDG